MAAEIYKDKYHCLTFNEIAELRGISLSNARGLYDRAKYILKHSEEMWTEGLSRRARQALLRNGYRSVNSVRGDLHNLHKKPSIGDKVLYEVRTWLIV